MKNGIDSLSLEDRETLVDFLVCHNKVYPISWKLRCIKALSEF